MSTDVPTRVWDALRQPDTNRYVWN